MSIVNQLSKSQKRALELLSILVSLRKGYEININNIMDYEDYRRDISEYKKEDFVIDGARGNLALSAGDVVLPDDLEKEKEENNAFFSLAN